MGVYMLRLQNLSGLMEIGSGTCVASCPELLASIDFDFGV